MAAPPVTPAPLSSRKAPSEKRALTASPDVSSGAPAAPTHQAIPAAVTDREPASLRGSTAAEPGAPAERWNRRKTVLAGALGLALTVSGGLGIAAWLREDRRGTLAVQTQVARGILPERLAEPARAWEVRVNAVGGAEMVYVPPGEFRMGTDPAERRALWERLGWNPASRVGTDDDSPAHRVQISKGLWVYKTEVTNAMYGRVCFVTGRQMPERGLSRLDGPRQLVSEVSWYDAVAYCEWAGMRLPTEAEWEYAARGTDGRVFPWGNQPPDETRAVFGLHPGSEFPPPVGHRPAGASPFGILDMAGSVSEWCSDAYVENYRGSPPVDPIVSGGDQGRYTPQVWRGGEWQGGVVALRASARNADARASTHYVRGFRAVQAAR